MRPAKRLKMNLPALVLMITAVWPSPVSDALPAQSGRQCVILLHGLARTEKSMDEMAVRLRGEGYFVLNKKYPSRTQTIEELAETVIPEALLACRTRGAEKIHFVTHSMGGILVRCYLKYHRISELGRVVMLSPPNQGSEVVDKLGRFYFFKRFNGPAGAQLSTASDSLPMRLGPVDFDLGVITGDRSVNLILSLLIPGPDDGKVSVKRARVEGMRDFMVVHATHPFIMRNETVIGQTINYLKKGAFRHNLNTE